MLSVSLKYLHIMAVVLNFKDMHYTLFSLFLKIKCQGKFANLALSASPKKLFSNSISSFIDC